MASRAQNTALLAPMPNASIKMTVSENNGDLHGKANGEAQVRQRGFDHCDTINVAQLFLDLLFAAELEDCSPPCLVGCKPCGNVGLRRSSIWKRSSESSCAARGRF